jgi:glycosyltransferase involved in cell wall biosynthesis
VRSSSIAIPEFSDEATGMRNEPGQSRSDGKLIVAGVIVHEWMSAHGGSEKVFEAMSHAFPDADLYTLWRDSGAVMTDRKIAESWFARTPLRRHKVLALPFMPHTWRTLRSGHPYDWMLVSSHLFGHHARFQGANRGIPKFVYAHTPARYIWTPELDFRGESLAVRVASAHYKPIDRRRATEPVAIAANSACTRDRIRQFWDRDATIIYPPVPVEAIAESARTGNGLSEADRRVIDLLPQTFILGASRFVSYKQLCKVISVGALLDVPVVIAGRGPEEQRLRAIAQTASVPVTFVIAPSDALLHALYARTAAYVFPPVEDFGMMPVEAMAAGAPVIVNALGGARESAGRSAAGVITDFADVRNVADRTRELIDRGVRPTVDDVAEFSEVRFIERVQAWVAVELGMTHAGSTYVQRPSSSCVLWSSSTNGMVKEGRQ